MSGDGKMPGRINYFVANNPAEWRTAIPTFARIQVADLYPGINLVYYGNQQRLEYDFTILPGANPDRIAIRFNGADHLNITPSGDLIVELDGEQVRQPPASIYQVDGDKRIEIAGAYQKRDERTVGFAIGAYDHRLPLIIDPVLRYSSFVGGLAKETARAIALDSADNIFSAGDTLSTQLGTTGAWQPVYAGGYPGGSGRRCAPGRVSPSFPRARRTASASPTAACSGNRPRRAS